MAEHTINSQPWPNGTLVSVYPREAQPAGQDTLPAGVAVTSASVASGSVTFAGLTEGKRYLAWAGGKGIGFLVQPGSVDTLRPITGSEAQGIRDSVEDRVRNSLADDPLNVERILQGSGTYDVRTSGIPNVAAVGNLDFAISTGDVISDDTSSKNRFQIASYIENDLNQPIVALFGMGKGKHAFGANIVGYTNGASHTSIGIELDYGNVGNTSTTLTGDHVLPVTTLTVGDTTNAASTGIVACGGRFWRYTGKTATTFTGLTFESGTNSGTITGGTAVFASIGGTSTGLLIVAIGGNVGGSPAGPYIQMHSQTASQATTGIKIHNSGQPAVMETGSLLQAAGEDCAIGINFASSKFSTAAAYVPINSGSTTASKGIMIDAQGGFANAGDGLEFRATGAGSSMANAITVRLTGGVQPISGALLRVSGAVACANGFNISTAVFSGAAFLLGPGHDFQLDTTTGTKIGTGGTQKLGFWNTTPIAKPAAPPAAATDLATAIALVNDLRAQLIAVGLR